MLKGTELAKLSEELAGVEAEAAEVEVAVSKICASQQGTEVQDQLQAEGYALDLVGGGSKRQTAGKSQSQASLALGLAAPVTPASLVGWWRSWPCWPSLLSTRSQAGRGQCQLYELADVQDSSVFLVASVVCVQIGHHLQVSSLGVLLVVENHINRWCRDACRTALCEWVIWVSTWLHQPGHSRCHVAACLRRWTSVHCGSGLADGT